MLFSDLTRDDIGSESPMALMLNSIKIQIYPGRKLKSQTSTSPKMTQSLSAASSCVSLLLFNIHSKQYPSGLGRHHCHGKDSTLPEKLDPSVVLWAGLLLTPFLFLPVQYIKYYYRPPSLSSYSSPPSSLLPMIPAQNCPLSPLIRSCSSVQHLANLDTCL